MLKVKARQIQLNHHQRIEKVITKNTKIYKQYVNKHYFSFQTSLHLGGNQL